MISLAPLQKVPKNVGDLGKLIVANGFKKLPKVQNIAKKLATSIKATRVKGSGHCDNMP